MVKMYNEFSNLLEDLKIEYNPDSIIVFGSATKANSLEKISARQDIDLFIVSPANNNTREVYSLGKNYVEALFNPKEKVEKYIKMKDDKLISMFRKGELLYDPTQIGQGLINLAKSTSLKLTEAQRYSYVGKDHNLITRIKEDLIDSDLETKRYGTQWLFDKMAYAVAMQNDLADFTHPKYTMKLLNELRDKKNQPEMNEFVELFKQVKGIDIKNSLDYIKSIETLEKIADKII